MNYPAWLSPLKPQWTGTVRINRFEDAQEKDDDLTFSEVELKRWRQSGGDNARLWKLIANT